MKTLWLRDETKPFERRTPLTPKDTEKILKAGIKVIVEDSKDRIFSSQDYKNIGCEIVDSGSWVTAPTDSIILGLKELDEKDSFPLTHKHIHFAHCYKGQSGSKKFLDRFKEGQGTLYDLEFLFNNNGRRIAAFGFWAGFIGAGVSLEIYAHQKKNPSTLHPPLKDFNHKDEYINYLKDIFPKNTNDLKAIVIGAKGRCGSGARELFDHLKIKTTLWDMEETKSGGPFEEILDHHIFVNCVLINKKIPPFISPEMLNDNMQLSVISDVSCDPNSPNNPIPIYSRGTTMDQPTLWANGWENKLEVQSVDHLPSLLPRESSEEFSNDFTPYLISFLTDDESRLSTWTESEKLFREKIKEIT